MLRSQRSAKLRVNLSIPILYRYIIKYQNGHSVKRQIKRLPIIKEVKDATEVKSVSLKDGKTSFESLSTDKVTFGKDKKEDSKDKPVDNTISDVTKTNDKNTPEAKKEDSDQSKKTEDTKVENNTLSAQDKSLQKLNPPLYAYDTIDVDDCFNVGLPITSVAAYGSEAAKYQMTRMQSIAQRQIQFDPTKHDNAVKVPNSWYGAKIRQIRSDRFTYSRFRITYASYRERKY